MNLLPIMRASLHASEWAARADADGGEDRADGADGPEQPPPRVPLEELQRRAGIMFSGITGAVVASVSGPATTAATRELARDAREVIRGLPAVLFDRSAKPRPCGLLCKLSAAGMLICDVLALPLTPFELAEPVGKEAARMADKISAEVKREKKVAGRRGKSSQEAEADFLRRRIKLPLPTAAEIRAAWRKLSKLDRGPRSSQRRRRSRSHLHSHRRHSRPAPPPLPTSPPPLETPPPPSPPAVERWTSDGFATDAFEDELAPQQRAFVPIGKVYIG